MLGQGWYGMRKVWSGYWRGYRVVGGRRVH